jgi:hypothetical protein
VFSPAAQQEILQLVDSNPAVVKYRDAMLQGPLAMGFGMARRLNLTE